MLSRDDTRFEIIATIGPSVLTGGGLGALVRAGVTMFRLNGAHHAIESLPDVIDEVRAEVGDRAGLVLDLPGRKVRTRNLGVPVRLLREEPFVLRLDQVSDAEFLRGLKPGSMVIAADGLLRFSVERQLEDRTEFIAHCEGLLEANRGLHAVGPAQGGAYLTDLDERLLAIARAKRLEYVSASYVRSAADVSECDRALGDGGSRLIAKIETDEAYRNLDEILDVARHILVDRGDLSSAIGLEEIPIAQQVIIGRARARGRAVFLATQFLRSMVEHPIPLIAEVESLYAAVRSGVQGVQLSEETAIGKFPVAAVAMVSAQVQRARGMAPEPGVRGKVIWLLGLSGCGKTTLAKGLQRALAEQHGIQAEILDGDAVRALDARPLGYSREDRMINIRRIIHMSKLLSRNNVATIVANISPYQELRALARTELPGYVEIHLDCPVEVCAQRDPKGLYARAARGEDHHVIGVGEPFEPPLSPDLVVNTAGTTEAEALRRILGYLRGGAEPSPAE